MNLAIIEAAIQAMINKPTRSSVNSNTAYVIFNLRKAGHKVEYEAYRDWVSMSKHRVPLGWEMIVKLQHELDAFDTGMLPSWATYNT